MKTSIRRSSLAFAFAALASTATAQVTTYTQDFESLNAADMSALANDGWLVFGNVFDSGGGFLYNYGPFPAPNDPNNAGFSVIAGGMGGAAQGAQYLNAYNDYNNLGAHMMGELVEANLFQEFIVDASNANQTWTFSFDYLKNPMPFNGDGATTTQAFIKVLDPGNGFALVDFQTLDTTGASTSTWQSDSLSTTIDPAWNGFIFQIGFSSTASNFDDSGRFYDNLELTSSTGNPPGMAPYNQDFESLNVADPNALSTDGWLVFANIFDPMGGFLFGYGVFPAPNGTGGFSSLLQGGSVHMDVFSDYNNTTEHSAGNTVEALVFQEQPIGAQDSGTNWTFSFDYASNPANNPASPSTTYAFVKVIKVSDSSFATLIETQLDTTGASQSGFTGGSIGFTVDPSYVGEVVQFGFASRATNFDDSSRLYDGIDWSEDSGLGTPYCAVNNNSTGGPASLIATGSLTASDNNFTLVTSNVPAFQFGFYVVSDMQGFVANVGTNGSGNLCLGGGIGRLIFPGQIINSGASGVLSLTVDLTQIPRPATVVSVMAGETWNFQGWFRDTNAMGASSNFSNGLECLFN